MLVCIENIVESAAKRDLASLGTCGIEMPGADALTVKLRARALARPPAGMGRKSAFGETVGGRRPFLTRQLFAGIGASIYPASTTGSICSGTS
jgi:hypothetical protein